MKDFGNTKKPETNADDPASKYRKTVKFVSRRPDASEKDSAVIRLVGGIKLAGMYWFQSPSGKRFAINTPFFDEDDETFIPGKCPIFDRGLTNPATVWAMNAINRYLQREEHNPNPIEVFPANKTEFGALMDLHHEHGAPNAAKRGYDIITRKWKSKGNSRCSIAVKTSMDGSSFTPLTDVEMAYTHYDLDLLYQPKAVGDYILDVIKAALLSKEIGGKGLYTPDDFKRDYDKYMPQDEQAKRAKARQGILNRFGELYEGIETEEQSDGRAPAMMGGGEAGTAPAPAQGPAPMPHNAMPANAMPKTQAPAPTPASTEPAPVPPATQQTAQATPTPPPPAAVAETPSAPPAAGTQTAAATPPTPAPAPANPAPTPPPAAPPPTSGKLNIPAAVNPAAPPQGMPNPDALMSTLAPGALGSIDDDDDEP